MKRTIEQTSTRVIPQVVTSVFTIEGDEETLKRLEHELRWLATQRCRVDGYLPALLDSLYCELPQNEDGDQDSPHDLYKETE